MLRKLLVAGTALVLTMSAAHASLIADGITYTLTETATASPTTNQFMLDISGINGSSDSEGGRYGVQSFAFTQPPNFLSATAPSGFAYQMGGLNSSGCDGSGNFFCFSANTAPSRPVLAANSILSYLFDLTVSSGSFSAYLPDFKVNWVGTKNNYNLVSLPLAPTLGVPVVPIIPVPEPGSLLILGTGLLGLGLITRRRRMV